MSENSRRIIDDAVRKMIEENGAGDATDIVCMEADAPGFPDDKFVAQDFTDVLREVEVTFLKDRRKVRGLQLEWAKRIGASRLMEFCFDKVS